jgi:hypothetical protein
VAAFTIEIYPLTCCSVSYRAFLSFSGRFAARGAHGFPWALSRPGICPGTLAPHWQAAPVPQSTITTKIHQPLYIHRNFTPKIAFDRKFRDLIPQFVHLGIGYIFDLRGGSNPGSRTNLARPGATNAVNGRQRDFGVLMIRDIYSSNTGHTLFLRKILDYNI